MRRFLYVLALVFGLPTSAQVYDIDIDDNSFVSAASPIGRLQLTASIGVFNSVSDESLYEEPDAYARPYSSSGYESTSMEDDADRRLEECLRALKRKRSAST